MLKKTIISIGICLSFADAAFAALGENEAQIEKRYGPAAEGPQVLEKHLFKHYLIQPYYIMVCFDESGHVVMERVVKMRAPSVNKKTPVAQEFNDQEIQDFLDASGSYDGAFVEEPLPNKHSRVWFSTNQKADAVLYFDEHTFKGEEKVMIQTLDVLTKSWSDWRADYIKRTGSN